MGSKQVVLSFWDAMKSNDFTQASQFLSEDFEGYWPQSGELILGRENFAAINSYYPAHGVWQFEIHTVVCEGDSVVTDVSVTDGAQSARAITFHTVKNGLIVKQTEFWPDEMAAQDWRAKWVKIVPVESQTELSV